MFDYSSIPAGYYDQVFNRKTGIQSKWHHMKFRFIAERVREHQTHLDIGAGPGTFIGLLPARQRSVGVDIAEDQIAYAVEKYSSDSKTFLCAGACPYPFPACSFEVITVIELIEHLSFEQGLSILKEAYRLLVPGGCIFVSTPNYSSLWPFVERVVNRLAPVSYEHQHITRFTPLKLLDLMGDAGFRQTKCHAYQGFSFLGAAIHWDLPDIMHRVERHVTALRYGLLLLGAGTKPCL